LEKIEYPKKQEFNLLSPEELDDVFNYKKKEKLSSQRERRKWLKEDDLKTNFFHKTANLHQNQK